MANANVSRGNTAMHFGHQRWIAMVLSIILAISGASAQTFFSNALDELRFYVKAASNLLIDARNGVDNATFDTLTAKERKTAKDRLKILSDKLQTIYIRKSGLLSNFEFFVKLAGDASKSEEEKTRYWESSVKPRIEIVRKAVVDVRPIFYSSCGGA
jgi:hypothetical protein